MRKHLLGLAALVLLIGAPSLESQQRPAATPPAAQPNNPDEPSSDPRVAPARREGEGPFTRLVIRGATLIDGSGAPPRGPVDIVVEGNQITQVASVGYPGVRIDSTRRPRRGDREIDATGMFVMPGLVDLHVHQGTMQKAPMSEYYNKLWLGHGITTVRGVPFAGWNYSIGEKARSAKNEITAPRYFVYQRPGTGWSGGRINTPEQARAWVRWLAQNGGDGLKLGAERPVIMEALIDEAKKNKLGTTAHLAQLGVAQMNADIATKLGLETITHFYGLFESLYDSNSVQPFPVDYNYNDEQHRFGQVARQWRLVTPRSEKWNQLLKNFKERDVTIDPTMVTYVTGRDLIHHMNAPWHQKYTLPTLMDFYEVSREAHGSYWFYWTTADEVAWKNFYRVWMMFLNDYKNIGGRVTASSDAGFIYNTPGFATIEELEMLQEAGFHPLEALRGATMHAAETLFKPKGTEPNIGVVRAGMLADMAIVEHNPLENFKVLYGSGALKLNDATGKGEWVGGVKWTIKDGIVYDAKQLMADVARMVEDQKRARGQTVTP